jgi:hypothetical protein
MLRGPWPRITSDGVALAELEADVAAGRGSASDLEAALGRLLAEAVRAQVETGMGLVTDGSVRWGDPAGAVLDACRLGDTGPDGMLVRAWRATAALTDSVVAQEVPGPLTLAIREAGGLGDVGAVTGRAGDLAELLAGELTALRAAGCTVIVVDEPGAVSIGGDVVLRDGFVRAHGRLLEDAREAHMMLAVAGGSANEAGAGTIVGLGYNSFLFDLLAGPDNWYLVREAAGDRGIVCGALATAPARPLYDQVPLLVWAAQYAASANGRGLDRVGISNASSLAAVGPAVASEALGQLALAAKLALMPLDEAVEAGLDPRAVRRMPGAPVG